MNSPREALLQTALDDGAGRLSVLDNGAEHIAALDWSELNQRWLARRFRSLAERLSAASAGATAGDADAGASLEAPGFEPAHRHVMRVFGLSPFEGDVLLLAAGAECDTPLRDALARIDGGSAPGVDFGIALAHLDGAHWDAVSALAPLRYWQLLRVAGESTSLAHTRLRIDERVLHHLTGVADVDARLQGVARLLPTDATASGRPEAESASASERLDAAATDAARDAVARAAGQATADAATDAAARAIVAAVAGPGLPLVLLGSMPHLAAQRRAARALVRAALQRLELRALWVDAGALDGSDPRAGAELARALDREALLSQAVVVLAAPPQPPHDGADAGPAALRLLTELQGPVILLGSIGAAELADLPERRCVRVTVPAPPPAPARLAPPLRRALQQFPAEPDAVAQALAELPAGDDDSRGAALWRALRVASRGGLDALAQRIESPTTLADLVLPAAALDTLRDITLQLRHRIQVHDDWGFAVPGSRGLGLATLFAGDSGTGKTCAAEAIANEAGLDLYRVDLALTVSKYIGETEKNLRRLFDAAEASGAVLLFDEADALFGKRSDVKDSHDRYANIEVAYLLQRIDSYRGLAILTTNMKGALDRAFLRRLRFIVNFPFPDEAARESLWRRQFPSRAPLGADIDWRALARLHLTGGHIRSVALNGAFRAAADGGAIAQRHLLDAARAEYQKLERSFGTVGGNAS